MNYVSDIRNLAKLLEQMADNADAIDRIGSTDQAVLNAQDRLDKINEELRHQRALREAAELETSDMLAVAQAKADSIVAAAVETAQELQRQAQETLTAAKAKAMLDFEPLQAEVAELEERADKARAYLSSLTKFTE